MADFVTFVVLDSCPTGVNGYEFKDDSTLLTTLEGLDKWKLL